MRRPLLTLVCSFAVTLGFLCSGSGCAGGGTIGTGGGLQVSGTLTTLSLTPLSGVQVSVATARLAQRSGSVALAFADDADTTDDKGQFILFTERGVTQVELEVKGQGINSRYTISGIPAGAAKVDLALQYNDQNDDIEDRSTRFEDDNGDEIRDDKGGSDGDGGSSEGSGSND